MAQYADYAYYELVEEWPELVIAVNELDYRLRRSERPDAADILTRGLFEFKAELVRIGRTMAAKATEELKKQEKDTRVRPDTAGGGGKRLGDYLIAEPLDESLLPGSVGVANEDVLAASVPWWVTNEIGSSARVGGVLFGTFHGGGSAAPPDQTLFRQHALFTPNIGPGSGLGIIEHPIPARRFILKSMPIVYAEWKVLVDAAKARMNDVMTRALATPR